MSPNSKLIPRYWAKPKAAALPESGTGTTISAFKLLSSMTTSLQKLQSRTASRNKNKTYFKS